MRPLALALAAALTLSAASCRRVHEAPAPGRLPVGWTTDFRGERVRGGRLLTTPAGHEEEILSALASAVRAWADGCPPPRVKSRTPAAFRLAISGQGALRGIEGDSADPFGTCLIGKARGQAAITARPGIDLAVDLVLDVNGPS